MEVVTIKDQSRIRSFTLQICPVVGVTPSGLGLWVDGKGALPLPLV